MNLKFPALVLSIALVPAALADVTVTLKDVHLCCNSCVKGVDKAVATVDGVAAKSDMDGETVTLTAPDQATAQKAVNALVAAGYFGVSSDPAIKLDPTSGAPDGKVQSLAVDGVHLCCKSCVTAVNEALEKVPGVKATTATKGAKSFEVTGDFNAKDVFTALHDAGLTGKTTTK
jgi:periplasmic mercuric ion binding protein